MTLGIDSCCQKIDACCGCLCCHPYHFVRVIQRLHNLVRLWEALVALLMLQNVEQIVPEPRVMLQTHTREYSHGTRLETRIEQFGVALGRHSDETDVRRHHLPVFLLASYPLGQYQ